MHRIDDALELSKAQARTASEAARAVSACIGAMLEVSAAFAKSSAERNAEFGLTLMGAKTVEGAAEIHGAFVRDSLRAAGVMATKIADACTLAAKQCHELAALAMRGAKQTAERS
jgi:hypothetical protein